LLAVVSGFSTLGVSDNVAVTSTDETAIVEEIDIQSVLTTKEKVEQYFSDIPVMIDIARCESRFIHLKKNGSLNRGVLTPADVGVMQINEKFHLKESKKLGYDIHTLEGNMAYARYLYEKQGARPWLPSSHCWAKYSKITIAI
jgi:hypothetical protein